MYFAPNISIAIPYIKSSVSREEKLRAIHDEGFEYEGSIYSIDENIWSRVIENGDLDDIRNPVKEDHFSWTKEKNQINEDISVSIGFKCGLPVTLYDQQFTLSELIHNLNVLGSRLQIGRFNGLEDTPLGPKNHEIREAPAAEIINKAKLYLETAILTQSELKLKSYLDYRWSELVVNGNWYSLEKNSVEAAISILNEPLNGSVQLELSKKSVFPSAVDAVNALDFNTLENEISRSKNGFSYSEYYHINSVHNKIRF